MNAPNNINTALQRPYRQLPTKKSPDQITEQPATQSEDQPTE